MGIVTRDLAHASCILATIRRLHDDAPDPGDDQPSRVRAAYHEAGHAVVARGLGIDVARVSVTAEGTGCCLMASDVQNAGELVFSAVAWAGFVGESAAAEFCVREHFDCWWDRGDDAEKIGLLTFDVPDAAAAGVLVAASIVSAERIQLDELARALIAHGSARPDPTTPKGWLFAVPDAPTQAVSQPTLPWVTTSYADRYKQALKAAGKYSYDLSRALEGDDRLNEHLRTLEGGAIPTRELSDRVAACLQVEPEWLMFGRRRAEG